MNGKSWISTFLLSNFLPESLEDINLKISREKVKLKVIKTSIAKV